MPQKLMTVDIKKIVIPTSYAGIDPRKPNKVKNLRRYYSTQEKIMNIILVLP